MFRICPNMYLGFGKVLVLRETDLEILKVSWLDNAIICRNCFVNYLLFSRRVWIMDNTRDYVRQNLISIYYIPLLGRFALPSCLFDQTNHHRSKPCTPFLVHSLDSTFLDSQKETVVCENHRTHLDRKVRIIRARVFASPSLACTKVYYLFLLQTFSSLVSVKAVEKTQSTPLMNGDFLLILMKNWASSKQKSAKNEEEKNRAQDLHFCAPSPFET